MLAIGYYIFCSISNKSKLKENSNSLHMYRIWFQAVIFKPKDNFSVRMLCFLLAKKVTRNSSESIFIRNMQGNILHSSNSERKDYFVKAQRNIHCHPAYTAAFSRMNYCQSTALPACCCLREGKTWCLLIQPEETLVKLYYFPLQQPQFAAANTIITPWEQMLSSSRKDYSPMILNSLAVKLS